MTSHNQAKPLAHRQVSAENNITGLQELCPAPKVQQSWAWWPPNHVASCHPQENSDLEAPLLFKLDKVSDSILQVIVYPIQIGI